MKDDKTHTQDWIDAWIAQQRELLEQQSAAAANERHSTDEMSQQWSALGQSFTTAWNQALGGASADRFDPFNIGNALLAGWNAANVFQTTFAKQAADTLGRLPPVGLAREQAEAWRELNAAQTECHRIENELRAVLNQVQLDALELLQKRVRERSADQPIENFRTLYDLWVECGEQVYGKLAHSEPYSKLQAELGNATMRLRMRTQTVLEHGLKQLDLPTRSELNSVHRQLRELRSQVEALQAAKSSGRRKPRTAVTRKTRSKASKR